MKKIFIFLILLVSINFAQSGDYMQSLSNNYFTLLGSSATFTGTWESNHGMGYLTLVMRANKNSATLGVKIQFSQRGVKIDKEYQFTYTANDTLTNTKPVPIAGNYFRIIYTNTNSAQTGTFALTTYLHRNSVLPLDANGNLLVTTSVIVPGVSTSANQSTQINYASPFTSSSGTLTTVSTEVDTTVFTATKWQTFGVFALNDTLEISLSGSFADAKMVLPYTEYTFEHFSPTTFPKGFIRRYGSVGTVSYIPTIIGF